MLTLFFAAALFFAGSTASFKTRFTKMVVLSGAVAALAIAGVQLVGFPVA